MFNIQYEFGGVLCGNHTNLMREIAGSWVAEDPARIFAEIASDEVLATEVIKAYGLDQPGDMNYEGDYEPSHMEFNEGYDADDLAKAFGQLRQETTEAAQAEALEEIDN